MTIAVWLRRLNHLRWVEGLMREARLQGHRVVGVLDASAHHPLKPAPLYSNLPPRMRGLATWISPDNTVWASADAIVTPGPSGDIAEVRDTPASIGHSIQTEWGAGRFLPEASLPWSRIGYPPADALTWTEPSEVRSTFGLTGRILLVLPFPHASTRASLWSRLWKLWGERQLSRALREYADRHDLAVVVKGRPKNPVPGHLADVADLVVPDDELGEPTTLRLLTIAKLMVHTYSMAAIEAVWADVPSICIAPTAKQWPAYARHLDEIDFPDLFSYGVRVSPERVADWMRGSGGAAMIRAAGRRESYLTRLFGSDQPDSGRRILAALDSARLEALR